MYLKFVLNCLWYLLAYKTHQSTPKRCVATTTTTNKCSKRKNVEDFLCTHKGYVFVRDDQLIFNTVVCPIYYYLKLEVRVIN